MAEVIEVEIEQASEQEQRGREDEIVSVCHAYDGYLGSVFWQSTYQPRPQGFSLKKWVGRENGWGVTSRCQGLFPPTHFLREKPWGRGCFLIHVSKA